MAALPFALPSYARLNRRLGRDHVAAQSIDGWWRFEDPLPTVLAALCADTQGAFYDVGANTGFYSVLVGRMAPTLTVRAFEPIPEIIGYLGQNLAIAGLAGRIAVEQVALSSSIGTAEVFLPPAGHGLVESSASLLSDFKETVAEVVVVATETLDAANARLGGERVGLIKIDVEGAEHLVIEGAVGVLARDRPVVAIELLQRAEFEAIEGTFADLGYRFLSMHPGFDIREQESLGYHADSWNHLLVHAADFDRVRGLLDDAAGQWDTFVADVGDPVDQAALERRAAELPATVLAEQVGIEKRACAAECTDAEAPAADLTQRIAALEAALANCRQRGDRLQASLELAQSQVSLARKVGRRVKRRLRPTPGSAAPR